MARLDELIAVNQRSAPVPADARSASVEARRSLCIVTCVDPRLTRFFSTVLGIDRGDAVLIRLPGANLLGGHADALRAVAAAVYINQATEVLILGHTDCGTTRIDAGAIASRMQAAGLGSQAMPGGPREFLGGVGDIRAALLASAAAVRSARFLPRDLLVHAAILDIQTGVLQVLERGESADATLAVSADDALAYRPGPGGLPTNPLGDGLLLLSSATHTLFSGSSALSATADALATPAALSSTLPPGWADGARSLTATPLAASGNTLDQLGNMGAMPEIKSTIDLGFARVDLAPGYDVPTFGAPTGHATPAASASPPPIPPPRQRRNASPKARTVEVEMSARPAPARRRDPAVQANIDKVRDFFRVEFPLDSRKKMARALALSLNGDQSTDQLLKLVLKPILESGQKRYKVIDEMIAIKASLSPLTPEEAYAVLSQLLE